MGVSISYWSLNTVTEGVLFVVPDALRNIRHNGKIYYYSCLFSMCALLSCSGEDTTRKLEVAKMQTERYYRFYRNNQDDSIIRLLSDDFLKTTGANRELKLLNVLHNNYGEIDTVEPAYSKNTDIFDNGGHRQEIYISCKVKYKSNIIIKETFKYVFSNTDSNKISYMEFEDWKEE